MIIINFAMRFAIYVVMVILIYVQYKNTIEENKGLSFVLFAAFLVIALITSYYPVEMYRWAHLISWPFVAKYALNLLEKKKETIDPIERILEHFQAEYDQTEIDEEEKKIVRAILKRFKLVKLGSDIALE